MDTLYWIGEVNDPKSELMRIAKQIAETNPKEAAILDGIICRLEHWQHQAKKRLAKQKGIT